jgi:hypothetical protein
MDRQLPRPAVAQKVVAPRPPVDPGFGANRLSRLTVRMLQPGKVTILMEERSLRTGRWPG